MAFAKHVLSYAVFTVPADGHRFKHILVMNGLDNRDFMASEFFKHTNPDAKLLKWKTYSDPQEVLDKLAEITRDAGPEYRALQGDEATLTNRKMRAMFPEKFVGAESDGTAAAILGPSGHAAAMASADIRIEQPALD